MPVNARFLIALWFSLIDFITSLFKKPSAGPLPTPVTARSPNATPNRPTPASVRVTHQRTSPPHSTWVKEPSPLKRPTSPISSTGRRIPSDPEYIFHPPSLLPNLSFSGIFATPPLLASPQLASDIELGPSNPQSIPVLSPGSPSPFRGSHHVPSPSLHTLHSGSPGTPTTSSSAVIVQLDRSTISPTTMSDGSLQVISLGDRPGFVGSPVKLADMDRLPSPWSPIGKMALSDVWVSVDGTLVNATTPMADNTTLSQNDSVAPRTVMLPLSCLSTTSLYSSSSALGALGISVFVNLDEAGSHVDTKDDPERHPAHDESRPTFATPRKRRDTHPFATSHATSQSVRSTKCLSTPLIKLDNAAASRVCSTTSISSMAYELRMGLFADGRSITAFDNIISLLDQASPESESTQIPLHSDAMQPVAAS